MATDQKNVTVESFLHALSSIDAVRSPAFSSFNPPPATSSSHESQWRPTWATRAVSFVSFSNLESPSARRPSAHRTRMSVPTVFTLPSPAKPTDPRTPFKLPSARPLSKSPPAPTSAFTRTSTASSVLAPPVDIVSNPGDRRSSRISSFGMHRSNSAMVAAEVQGMGRVALARETLVERLGSETAEKAIAAAGEPLPALSFGHVFPNAGPPALDAFGNPSSARKSTPSQVAATTPLVDQRLGFVRSWLESSPELADEDPREPWPKAEEDDDDQHDPVLHRVTGSQLDVEDADADEATGEVDEIRVGGKSVRLLLRSKRRREEDDGQQRSPVAASSPDLPLVEAPPPRAPPATPRSATGSRSGTPPVDHSTPASGCLCGRGDDEGGRMVQCDDCCVWYHLKCLRIPSASSTPKSLFPSGSRPPNVLSSLRKELGQEWFCFRCADVAPVRTPQAPAESSAKRPKLIHPSTPVFYREPTFAPTSVDPQPPCNVYLNRAADVVLAPTPHTSSIRHFPPPSPTQHYNAPVTPQFGHVRLQSTPRSPLFFRAGRTRMVSGAFDDLPSAGQGGWVSSWDGHVFGVEEPMTPVHEEEDWANMTLTPSRSLSTTAAYGSADYTMGSSSSGGHHYEAYSQRLFSSPVAQQLAGPFHSSPTSYRSRVPSNSLFFPIQAGSYSQQQPLMDSYAAPQASGMAMSTSGLGIGFGFGQVQLHGALPSRFFRLPVLRRV